jgi:hypothetical protein
VTGRPLDPLPDGVSLENPFPQPSFWWIGAFSPAFKDDLTFAAQNSDRRKRDTKKHSGGGEASGEVQRDDPGEFFREGELQERAQEEASRSRSPEPDLTNLGRRIALPRARGPVVRRSRYL